MATVTLTLTPGTAEFNTKNKNSSQKKMANGYGSGTAKTHDGAGRGTDKCVFDVALYLYTPVLV